MNKAETAFVDTSVLASDRVRVWHFAVILRGVVLGDDVSVGSHAEIGARSIIGARTRIGKGVFLPSDSRVGCDVFIGPGTTFCDDKYPRANNSDYHAQPPIIEDGASVGAGVVVLPGVRIGSGAMVGAGAVVTEDVEPGAVVYGNPARSPFTNFDFTTQDREPVSEST
jgi:acetyltransferase-like isoleucine patch superfamily enzyme